MPNEIVLLRKDEITHTEVVMPSEDLLARIVNARISELLTEAQTAELEPFFERQEITWAILRSQHVIEKHKWHWLFEAYGCLICERREPAVRYACCGMCQRCVNRTRERLNAVKRQHAPSVTRQEFKDTVRLAREAVLPSVGALARKRGEK